MEVRRYKAVPLDTYKNLTKFVKLVLYKISAAGDVNRGHLRILWSCSTPSPRASARLTMGCGIPGFGCQISDSYTGVSLIIINLGETLPFHPRVFICYSARSAEWKTGASCQKSILPRLWRCLDTALIQQIFCSVFSLFVSNWIWQR